MRLGGMAARKRPIGRKAARAFRKPLKPSVLQVQCIYSIYIDIYIQ